jgi:Uma2 family endonuclease
MTIAANPKILTPEDLLSMPDSVSFELVGGQLVERKMGWNSSWVAANLLTLLVTYLRAHPIGRAAGADASYQCFPDDPSKVRKPDVSFVRVGRFPGEMLPKGHCRLAPDLAAEVVSPNDQYSEVEEKVTEYLEAGVRLVWILDPPTRSIRVERADGSVARLGEDDDLDGEDVVPGFRCKVSEVFADPAGNAASVPVNS